jgi:hypothetical protein
MPDDADMEQARMMLSHDTVVGDAAAHHVMR